MRAIQAYLRSFRGRTAVAAVYFWLANLAFTLPALLGFNRVISGAAGDSLLLEQTDVYGSFTVWMELFNRGGAGLRLLGFQLLMLIPLFVFFSIFLSGGAFHLFIHRASPGLRRFLRNGWNVFPSFLQLFVTCWLIWIPLLLVAITGSAVLSGILRDTGNEAAFRWIAMVWGCLVLVMYAYGMAVYDFSRIRRLQGSGGNWRAFRSGIAFVHRNAGSILFLYILFLVPFLLLFPVTAVLRGASRTLSPILVFLVLQAVIWLRVFLKAVLMHAETLIPRSASLPSSDELDAKGEPDTI